MCGSLYIHKSYGNERQRVLSLRERESKESDSAVHSAIRLNWMGRGNCVVKLAEKWEVVQVQLRTNKKRDKGSCESG